MKYLLIEKSNEICILTLNRPRKHNAFNQEFLQELQEFLKDLKKDKNNRLLIITGAGNKSFCSGVDLEQMMFDDIEQAREFALQLEATNEELLRFPKPLIAAINGHAFGGGFGLAASADVRIIVDWARVAFPAVRLGAIMPAGCTLRINALIGAGRSRELMLSGRVLDTQEALQMGLVNHITSEKDLMPKAYEIAAEILKAPDLALSMSKQIINQELLVQLQQYSVSAAENFAYLAVTDEWKNRMRNFKQNK